LSAACLLAYANLLQREKEKGKKQNKKTKNQKTKKNKKKQTRESNKDWVPWG